MTRGSSTRARRPILWRSYRQFGPGLAMQGGLTIGCSGCGALHAFGRKEGLRGAAPHP
jgi:hypothetical protein